jgi:hypothetical protein
MNYSYKKYVILAILGSLIIGVSVYLFLNSYLEKTGIIVLKENISKGEILNEDKITVGYYLKNSLPQGYIKNKADVLGKTINTDRFKGDYLTLQMLLAEKEKDLIKNLKPDEAIMSINIDLKEKITEELKTGKDIILVSLEKDKELEDLFYKGNINGVNLFNNNDKVKNNNLNNLNSNVYDDSDDSGSDVAKKSDFSVNYLESSVFNISENVSLIDGYLILKNIKILEIKNFEDKSNSLLSNNGNNLTTLYLKCKINESPYLAKLTSSGKYKIIIGSNG